MSGMWMQFGVRWSIRNAHIHHDQLGSRIVFEIITFFDWNRCANNNKRSGNISRLAIRRKTNKTCRSSVAVIRLWIFSSVTPRIRCFRAGPERMCYVFDVTSAHPRSPRLPRDVTTAGIKVTCVWRTGTRTRAHICSGHPRRPRCYERSLEEFD